LCLEPIVVPPVLSDHSLLIAILSPQSDTTSPACSGTKWASFDVQLFQQDLPQPKLLIHPSTDCAELRRCYDETLRILVDKHAPSYVVTAERPRMAPWFSAVKQWRNKLEMPRKISIYTALLPRSVIGEILWRPNSSQTMLRQFVPRPQLRLLPIYSSVR
jgi:hypothetical protein